MLAKQEIPGLTCGQAFHVARVVVALKQSCGGGGNSGSKEPPQLQF